ncbi:MAG: cytochrome c oxidase subunit 3 family protein [Panacagrimonas sp.]
MEAATTGTKENQRLPGVEGVWVFIGADMVFFAVLFVSFMLGRLEHPELFEVSRLTLNPDFGGINTLILLTSSWFVVLAVEAAKRDRLHEIPRWLGAAFICGLAFGVSKAIEYGGKLHAGISPVSNDFYMYYYVLTGFHLLHVTAGSIMLLVFWKMSRARAFGSSRIVVLECGATYWHMVDLLWIVLFPLLYLMR